MATATHTCKASSSHKMDTKSSSCCCKQLDGTSDCSSNIHYSDIAPECIMAASAAATSSKLPRMVRFHSCVFRQHTWYNQFISSYSDIAPECIMAASAAATSSKLPRMVLFHSCVFRQHTWHDQCISSCFR